MKRAYADYRHSGYESIGDIPAHWRVLELGRVGSFFKGGGGTKEDETDEGNACIRYGDLYTRHDHCITESRSRISPDRIGSYTELQYGDLLFAGSGETMEEIGKSAVNLLREPAFCGGDVIILRPDIDMDAAYLGYAADCDPSRHQKSRMGRGVTVMHIYGSELKYLAIPAPPLDEQRSIAAFLDRETAQIDKLISKQELLLERLDEYRTALITRTVTRGLPPEAAEADGLDPAPSFKESGVEWLGRVPKHWEVGRLRDVADLANGYPFDSQEFDPYEGMPLVRIRDLYTDETEIKWSGEIVAEALIGDGDILIGMDGEFNVSYWQHGAALLNQRLCCLRSDVTVLQQRFLYYLLPLPLGALNNVTYATTVKHLSSNDVLKFRVPLPPVEEQRAILAHLDASTDYIDELRVKAEASVERLSEYRSALVSAAVTGKIDVRESAAAGSGGGG